jgi:hypothetical protein
VVLNHIHFAPSVEPNDPNPAKSGPMSLAIPDGSTFMTGDVSHFFMTGDPLVIANASSSIIDDDADLKRKVRDTVFFLLTNQYIILGTQAKCDNPDMHTVIKGSGMGLPHSSAVSESALLSLSESALVIPDYLSSYGILRYFRFKDDILIIAGPDREKCTEFFQALIQKSKPFEIACEQISSTSVEFLELTLSIECGKIICCNRTKQTALPVPFLAMDSDHHPRVLKSWPICFAKRKCSLCTKKSDSVSVLAEVVSKFRVQGFPSNIINKLQSIGDPSPKLVLQAEAKPRKLWMVLPYKPAFCSYGFDAKFKEFCSQTWFTKALDWGGSMAEISVSWSNGSKSLAEIVKIF